jgi:hypothetical protein
MSTPTTCSPCVANVLAVGKPIYPNPRTQILENSKDYSRIIVFLLRDRLEIKPMHNMVIFSTLNYATGYQKGEGWENSLDTERMFGYYIFSTNERIIVLTIIPRF